MARKNQMANGMAANIPGSARPLKLSAPAQPLVVKWLRGEAGGDHAHEHQQLEDGQQGDDQLEGGSDADAENIERHKRSRRRRRRPISDPAPETAR